MENMVIVNKEFWLNKRVLITGHTGFKGSWLLVWLNLLGADVYGLSLSPLNGKSLFKEITNEKTLSKDFFVDIRDIEKLNSSIKEISPDIVFHLAAQPLVRESYKNPLETWSTNLLGSLNLLESLSIIKKNCAVIMVTTDKVYKNMEWEYGYRENDQLGGHDPYSASKAAAEIAISSWRDSFCYSDNKGSNLAIASARSGNVIGGGDWAKDRIFPDVIRSLENDKKIFIRNPNSTRPWQHVLDPLAGYIILAEKLYQSKNELHKNSNNLLTSAFNFGPNISSNKSVESLVNEIIKYWPGTIKKNDDDFNQFHEAKKLHLQIDKAFYLLNWEPIWNLEFSVKKTVEWYKKFREDSYSSLDLCTSDIQLYEKNLTKF